MTLTAKLIAMALCLAAVHVATPAPASTLNIAKKYVGLHERKHTRTLWGLIGANPARTPWCGLFVTAIVRKAGKKPPRASSFARSWARYGKKVARHAARPGDIVVIRNGRGYHVGLFVAFGKGTVKLLGGNQSNRVQVSQYRTSKIVAIRR